MRLDERTHVLKQLVVCFMLGVHWWRVIIDMAMFWMIQIWTAANLERSNAVHEYAVGSPSQQLLDPSSHCFVILLDIGTDLSRLSYEHEIHAINCIWATGSCKRIYLARTIIPVQLRMVVVINTLVRL